jgi:hypothetical protein
MAPNPSEMRAEFERLRTKIREIARFVSTDGNLAKQIGIRQETLNRLLYAGKSYKYMTPVMVKVRRFSTFSEAEEVASREGSFKE